MTTQNALPYSLKLLEKRKKLMLLPVVLVPSLIGLFASLGGGQGISNKTAGKNSSGFNNELPKANFDRKDDKLDKMGYYARADADSVKKQEIARQDPYHKGLATAESYQPLDSSAGLLIKQIDQLRTTLKQPTPGITEPPASNSISMHPIDRISTPAVNDPSLLLKHLEQISQTTTPAPDTPENDPQLEKLNTMLDKIIKIQKTVQGQTSEDPGRQGSLPGNLPVSETGPPSETKTIPAVVEGDQTLVSGSRIALRITEKCMINGIPISKDQLVYGWGTINKERLDILIDGIREGNSIFPVRLQVYDMDGMAGIFIPGLLTRDVSKESADQGISTIGLYPAEGSITSQATSAGIQAAKSLLHHKIKLVRVTVKSGYRVLLRNMSSRSSKFSEVMDTTAADAPSTTTTWAKPPLPYLHQSTSNGKVHLTLLGIYLKDKTLWFSYTIQNKSPIDFISENTRWFIRDRRQLKRTAIQEIPLNPVYSLLIKGVDSLKGNQGSPPEYPQTIAGDSSLSIIAGFEPFALTEEKELVLQMGEQHGGRLLVLTIHPKDIIKSRKL